MTITYGGGVTAFTDYRIAQIEDKIVPMLSDGSYYKASDTYIEMCADTLDFYADKGAPLDSGNDPAKGWIKWVFVFVIPLAVACIVCGIFYAQMKTANEQTHANAYMPAEGLALSVVEDTYTHTTETEALRPRQGQARAVPAGRVPTATVLAAARAENSKAIPHNSKCRYGERGAVAAKPKAQIILCVLSSILATQMPCRSRRSGA